MFSILFILVFIIFYIILNLFSQFIFFKKIDRSKVSWFSILIILFSGILIFSLMYLINNPELANRYQHAIGGGFLGTLVSYLALRDAKIKLNTLQMILLIGLIVNTLGIFNEIAEFFFQANTGFIFNDNLYDTWLDLTSNLFGIILGSALITIISKNNEKEN